MVLKRRWFAVALLTILPAAYGSTAVLGPALPTPPAATDSSGPSTSFTVSDHTEIPGKTLSAGTYTIRVVDHLSDRMILRVEKNGKLQSTFLALPKSNLARGPQGPINLDSSKKTALRGFVFPDGTVAEFVYPKAEAVTLAKAGNTTIPAVDPASEGRPDASKLSREDMQMVTLWMLTPTQVGPGDGQPGIEAARYQQPTGGTRYPSSSAVARTPPPPPAAPRYQPADTPPPPPVASAAVPPRPHTRPAMAALPHTAGDMPLVLLTGLTSLGAAAFVRRRRTA